MIQQSQQTDSKRAADIQCIHLYVNGIDPFAPDVTSQQCAWTLPLSLVNAVLNRLGQPVSVRTVIVDGYEPMLDGQRLNRLVAYAHLYQWHPVVNTTGECIDVSGNIAEKFEKLACVGHPLIKFNLTASFFKRHGIDAFDCFCRAAKKHSIPVGFYYALDEDAESSMYLRKLLHSDAFNELFTNIYIRDVRDVQRRNCVGFARKMVIGHRGSLIAHYVDGDICVQQRLTADLWHQELEKFFEVKEKSHA